MDPNQIYEINVNIHCKTKTKRLPAEGRDNSMMNIPSTSRLADDIFQRHLCEHFFAISSTPMQFSLGTMHLGITKGEKQEYEKQILVFKE
jgi:hypothetical protein